MRRLAVLAVLVLAACGGGNSSTTTLSGGGVDGGTQGPVVSISEPAGDNTTEIVVDSGPAEAFALGVANVPYVNVTVCAPGSTTACRTIDHVILDTGSIGLRLLRSSVAGLGLPAQMVPADAATGTPAGQAVECYPFVIGGIWGPVVQADVQLGNRRSATIPVQLVDDGDTPLFAPTADCKAAVNDALLTGVTTLQAKGVLGVGMLRYDCGLACDTTTRAGSYVQYYACSNGACAPARMPAEIQLQNPVVHLPQDNNGTQIVLPAVPDTGASLVKGRLVLGIGTQANNQLAADARFVFVDNDPASADYLYVATTANGRRYPVSYIDSGSNGLFFDDPAVSRTCAANAGTAAAKWYCPGSVWRQPATLAGPLDTPAAVELSLVSADRLFATSNVAFATLGGTPGPGEMFVWGLPFFYGRTVSTSIWGQPLALGGPWWAF